MDRIYLQRANRGYRTVRGEVVRRVQLRLKAAGSDPGEIDGIYGSDTETAITGFQRQHDFEETGKITAETWAQLMEFDPPTILDRCLQLTGDFEGHGFQKIVGNFDGAGLTWGIIGFTLQHGELKHILNDLQNSRPLLLDQAFGPLKDELFRVLRQNWPEQLVWANSISLGSKKYRIEPAWEQAFESLGSFPEVQTLQLERVNRYWEIALRDVQRFGLETERGLALCFDTAVQNGGIGFGAEERRIRRFIAHHPDAIERDRRMWIADVVAEQSRSLYVEDVRQRKLAIATGRGLVHGARYATQDWGITEHPMD